MTFIASRIVGIRRWLSGVILNGSSYLTRGADFTGAADSKLVTGSFWIYLNGLQSGGEVIIAGPGGAGFQIDMTSGDGVLIRGQNAGATSILNVNASGSLAYNRWHHVAFSFDLSDTGKRHVYVNGASFAATYTTYTNDSLDFTKADWAVACRPDGVTGLFTGRLAEVWIAFGQYLDLSVGANLAKFISGGEPVSLGLDGSTPTGTAPTLYLSGGNGFISNRGTGGGMTLTGVLNATSPVELP